MIDKLEYSYNGNQLLKVKDVSKNTKGYPSIPEHHEIEYDDNGNMTKHLDKEIHLVTYNFLNLPQQLINGRGEYHYNYRSDGVKVRETNYYDNAYTSDYLDNFKYKTYLRGEDREAALLFAPPAAARILSCGFLKDRTPDAYQVNKRVKPCSYIIRV